MPYSILCSLDDIHWQLKELICQLIHLFPLLESRTQSSQDHGDVKKHDTSSVIYWGRLATYVHVRRGHLRVSSASNPTSRGASLAGVV